jgi:hypothetical protein
MIKVDKGTARPVALPLPFKKSAGSHACLSSSERELLSVLQRSAEHFFVPSVLHTDEAGFGRDNIINIHNQHQWTEENFQGVSIADICSSSALICG